MTPDTFSEMVLGFSVLMGILLVYSLSLLIRTLIAKRRYQKTIKK
jgi:hypothetical protein